MPRPSAAKADQRDGSTIRRTVLPGGLRVVTEFVPSVRSASVGLWVNVGSRDEGTTVAGAAHLLEHLLFKATPTRTSVEIAQAVDAVGGELNAFTGKEHTCYYAHVLDSDLALAVDLVADVVLRAQLSEQVNKRFGQHIATLSSDTAVGQLFAEVLRDRNREGRKARALVPLGKDRELLQAIADPCFTVSGMTIREIPNRRRYLLTNKGHEITTALNAMLSSSTQKLMEIAA